MAGSALKRLIAEYKQSVTRGHCYKLSKPRCNTTKQLHSFSQRVITHWNSLSEHVIASPSVDAFKELTLNPPDGIVAGPSNEENFFEWEALITGPEGTCFEGGVFPAILTFPTDYPLGPPKMKFTCDIFHPNIYPDGRVCISILHAPGDDPMGYESSAERWSPVQSVEKILLSVVSMLAEPNDESAANVDAAKTWRDDRKKFEEIAHKAVRKSLGF